MLLDNQKRSRSRVLGGTAATAVIGLAALGLTASGTHAAETVRTTVEDRIGVKLADVTLPSLTPLVEQEAPAAPAPVRAPEAPSEPTLEVEGDGTHVYRTRQDGRTIVLRQRGRMDRAEIDKMVQDAEASRIDAEKMLADVEKRTPHVIERKCGVSANRRDFMTEEKDGDRRRLVICTDRIEKMAADASERGARAQFLAMSSARMGTDMARMSLRHARKTIEIDRNLTTEQRAQALAGIDQAMAELTAQPDD